MSLKKRLETLIRGWLPKEPILWGDKSKTAETKAKVAKEKPWWWRHFWLLTIIALSPLIIVQCIAYLLGYIDIWQLFSGILGPLAVTPMVYAFYYLRIKYQTSKPVQLLNKITFIGFGGAVAWAITFFGTALIILAKGLPPPTNYLGPEATLIVIFVVPWVVGCFIGYWLGKGRDFRPLFM